MTSPHHNITHVIYDLDGLLLDTEPFYTEVTQSIVSRYGRIFDWSIKAQMIGKKAAEAARIRAFYVHPRWSRRGVGSRILTACEDAARAGGFNRIELVATLPGEPLYAARGYEKAEAMQLKTLDGESLPAFRMTKSL